MTYKDKDGNVRLLPGYKFDPTDEVLVGYYLKRRVFAQPLPFQIIQDFDLFQTEPWGLPGGVINGKKFNGRKCFFYNTMGRDLENFDVRVVGSGEWRVMEKEKDVHIPQNNQVVGKRNTLNFWEVQGICAKRTKWVMHEFLLALIANPTKSKNEKKLNSTKESNAESFNGGKNNGSAEVKDLLK
ncbi:NAC domain-containing protein 83-like [Lotus japonicus]|uniref:NAC domain-containing protein 83-like n=1 Tax=Lotus japonicus TaxID=34305 RepID=UPI0025895589|nr:NAC domain-containing protein 83-like [Lotus japonicus]